MKAKTLHVLTIAVAAVWIFAGFFGTAAVVAAGPCDADVARFCPQAQGKQALGCLKQFREELSPACEMHIVQVLEAVKEAHQDCEEDIHLFCPGVQPGGGRIMNCLKAQKAVLSPACKAGLGNLLLTK